MRFRLREYGFGWWMIYVSGYFNNYLGAAKTWRGAWQHIRGVLK